MARMTVQEFKLFWVKSGKAANETNRRNKYNAKKCTVDNITFDSKAEARFYQLVKFRQLTGEIKYFLMQVPFRLPGGTIYRVDFVLFMADGSVEYIDVKGFQTQVFKIKKREIEAVYPIELKIVKL
jgi:hypothetical protein